MFLNKVLIKCAFIEFLSNWLYDKKSERIWVKNKSEGDLFYLKLI